MYKRLFFIVLPTFPPALKVSTPPCLPHSLLPQPQLGRKSKKNGIGGVGAHCWGALEHIPLFPFKGDLKSSSLFQVPRSHVSHPSTQPALRYWMHRWQTFPASWEVLLDSTGYCTRAGSPVPPAPQETAC